MCDREASKNEAALAPKGLSSHWKKEEEVCDTTVQFLVEVHCDNIWNHLHLKELEILSKMVYYLKYDKLGLPPSCFSGPDLNPGPPARKAQLVATQKESSEWF